MQADPTVRHSPLGLFQRVYYLVHLAGDTRMAAAHGMRATSTTLNRATRAGSPAGCEGSRAQCSLVLLVGMLGHPGWSWTVVPDDGRTITVRPAEVRVLSRSPQVELVPCRRR